MEKEGLTADVLLLTESMEVFARSQNPGATLRILDRMKTAPKPDLRVSRDDDDDDDHAKLLTQS